MVGPDREGPHAGSGRVVFEDEVSLKRSWGYTLVNLMVELPASYRGSSVAEGLCAK